MPQLSAGQTASIILAPADSYTVSASATTTVKGIYGAPSTTTTLTANFQMFGPYSVPAKLDISCASGTATYSLIGSTLPANWADETGTTLRTPAGGSVGVGVMLMPSGGDDTAAMQAWVNQKMADGSPALLGPGDFIVTGPMVWRSGQVIDKWGNPGIGLIVKGAGPGLTRIYYSGPSGQPMISVNSPISAGIGRRNYMTSIESMSWLRATSGTTQVAPGTTSGSAFYGVPSEQYEVIHTPQFKNLFIDGFDYHVTLSDCTLPEFENVWFHEFLSAVRSGYNQDIVKFRHCMFGSEQFGTSYRNNAIAFANGFSDGIWPAGSENIVEFEHCWLMKIGKAFEGNTSALQGIRFNRCYFEDVRQYMHHKGIDSGYAVVSFSQCHFSHPATNDTAQSDPTLANYMAKIQFDGDVATGAGKIVSLSMRDNTADLTAPANAWVSFVHVDSHIIWENNAMMVPSATFGHIRCVRTSKAAQRSFPQSSGLYNGSWVLGDKNGAGLAIQSGTAIEASQTIAPAGTYNINHYNGTHFYLTLPDGDCTIQIDAPSTGYYANSQTRAKVVLIAPSSVTATRTITFGSRLTGAGATLTYTTTDNNKRAILMLEGTGKGDVSMRCINGTPSFI